MQNQLPPEENLTAEIVFFLTKVKLAFKFLFASKSILIINQDLDVVNYTSSELFETIEAMYRGSLVAQNKEFETNVDKIANHLIAS